MKTLVLAFLAVMPLALCELPKVDNVYYRSTTSEDNCLTPPDNLETIGVGQELTLFNCNGKEAGSVECYCVAGKVEGQQLPFKKMCARCGLVAIPEKGFTEVFQSTAFKNLLFNLIEKVAHNQILTEDDLYYFGANNSIKIPIMSPKKMDKITFNIKQWVKNSQQFTDNDKEGLVHLINTAFKRYSGISGLKSFKRNVQQMLDHLERLLPRISEYHGVNVTGVDTIEDLFKINPEELIKLFSHIFKRPHPVVDEEEDENETDALDAHDADEEDEEAHTNANGSWREDEENQNEAS